MKVSQKVGNPHFSAYNQEIYLEMGQDEERFYPCV